MGLLVIAVVGGEGLECVQAFSDIGMSGADGLQPHRQSLPQEEPSSGITALPDKLAESMEGAGRARVLIAECLVKRPQRAAHAFLRKHVRAEFPERCSYIAAGSDGIGVVATEGALHDGEGVLEGQRIGKRPVVAWLARALRVVSKQPEHGHIEEGDDLGEKAWHDLLVPKLQVRQQGA